MNLVPDDGAAGRPAPPLVLGIGLPRALLNREVVLFRQAPILHEGEGRAAKLVRARLGDGVDHRARRAAVLGIVLPGDDLEFLNRFDRRPRLGPRALPDDVVVVVAAVEHVVVVPGILAVHGNRIAAERFRADGGDDSGKQPDEADEIAVDAGQLHQRLAPDVAAELLRRHVHERRLARHGDGLLDRSDRQRDVDAGGLSDLEPQLPAIGFLEALELSRYLIGARDEAARDERAVGARHRLAEHARPFVPDDHRGARQNGPLFVDDASTQFRRALLRGGSRGHDQRKQHQAHYT